MKILRIETHNLNSLYGRHVVDLEGTLGAASLFLIHGPTGSGKSTLMDAVSLALFGKTPRLDGKTGDAARNPRGIMSRGEGECSAEVVFSKLENGARQIYRARWQCQRARRKPDGKLQTAKRSLERRGTDGAFETIVSSALGKIFKPRFEEVLEGFDVNDFNRSMLLAQGQFDAFLDASADERAEILERLTDTTDYLEIGDRAQQINAKHSEKLKVLKALAEAGGGLDTTALAAVEAAHAAHTQHLTERAAAEQIAAAHLKWFDTDTALAEVHTEAQAALATLAQEREALSDDLQDLARHDRCAAAQAFVHLDAVSATQAHVKVLAEGYDQLEEQLPALLLAESTAAATATKAAATTAEAEAQLDALRPLAATAAKTQERLDSVASNVAQRAAHFERAAATATTNSQAADAAAAVVEQLQTELAEAKTARDAHPATDALAADWPPLRSALDALISTLDGLMTEQDQLATSTALHAEKQALLAAADAVRATERAQAIAPIDALLASRRQALDALLGGSDYQAARLERSESVQRARLRYENILAAMAPVAAAEAAARDRVTAATAIETAQARRATTQAAAADQRAQLEQHAAASKQAETALRRTQRVADVAVHRGSLEPGTPCPLCGACEHPWADDPIRRAEDAVIEETIAAAEADQRKAAAVLHETQRTLSQTEGALAAQEAQLARLSEQRDVLTAREARGATLAHAALDAAGYPPTTSHEALDGARITAQRESEEAAAATEVLESTHRALTEAQAQHRAAVAQQDQIEADLSAQKLSLKAAGDALEARRLRAQEGHAEAARRTADCRKRLEPYGLPLDEKTPTAWRHLGDEAVEAHTQRVAQCETLQGRLKTANGIRQGKLDLRDTTNAMRDESAAHLAAAQETLIVAKDEALAAQSQLHQAWTEVLAASPDRPTSAAPAEGCVAAQRGWLEGRKLAHKAASTAYQDALNTAARARERLATLNEQRGLAEAALAQAQSTLNTTLATLEIDALTLEAARLSKERHEALTASNTALQLRTAAAEALLETHTDRLKVHRTSRPEAVSDTPNRDLLERSYQAAQHEHDAAKATHQATRDQLRDHHNALEAQAAHRDRLHAAEKAARIWRTLHKLIGARNGRAFRQFAQALNLGLLLDKANVHLGRLTDRYQLQPRMDEDLPTLKFDLSDLWQAGQRVAPRSLSGGERFLVSLSLALGLSDFRSIKMPIETLLLDEGFGTLDQQTLGVALGALSQLQADGRQVGIISHVLGLQERIEARIEVKPLGGGRSTVI